MSHELDLAPLTANLAPDPFITVANPTALLVAARDVRSGLLICKPRTSLSKAIGYWIKTRFSPKVWVIPENMPQEQARIILALWNLDQILGPER